MKITKEFLYLQGYTHVRYVEGWGWCGIMRFIYTVGLCHGLDEEGYNGRWCFHTMKEAEEAFRFWNGEGDPSGEWIKHKGKVEYANPKNI